jgi:hypothetical protein
MPGSITRRQMLRGAAVVVGALSTAAKAIAAPCASPSASDSGMRQSLHYVEASPNPAQKCSGCSFFSDPKGACGQCAIFSGPANIDGHCDSWAARS